MNWQLTFEDEVLNKGYNHFIVDRVNITNNTNGHVTADVINI